MINYQHTETALPTLAGAASPQSISFLVLRTDQGIVRLRTTVKGRPVAIVIDRSTYQHEPDSVLGFVDMDDPAKIHGPSDYLRAANKIAFTFNWYYVDDQHIAYFSSARLPRRAPGTDLDLPRWGTPRYRWRGFLPLRRHPHVIDPKTGFIDNWNNKLAPGFASSSQVYGDGSVYRSLTLQDRIAATLRHGHKMTRHGLVAAMIDAATVDVRGAYDLPYVLRVLGRPRAPRLRAAVAVLRAWSRSGAHRLDRGRVGHYAHQAAIDLFDTWWDPADTGADCGTHCAFSLPEDAMRGGLGGYVRILPEPIDDHPREHIGSAFNGISWYGYLNKDLRDVLHLHAKGRYSRLYCGPLAQCRRRLRASLGRALDAALRTEKVSSVRKLTYDETRDDIVSVAGGVVGVRPIRWQNRPTYQQVVQFRGHR